MSIYKLTESELIPLHSTSFTSEGVRERYDLQRLIRKDITILSADYFLLSEEFSGWEEGRRRIDLLALDKAGNLVVIELKRDDLGAHMELQALRYAAMVSTMTFEQAVREHSRYLASEGVEGDAERRILDFLEWDEPGDDFARDVQIVLVAADFSKELTTAVLWLNQRQLNIRCIRMRPFRGADGIFVDVQQVIPLPEAEEYQIRVREQATERREARESSRDLTKYLFEGKRLHKSRLVLAVVKAFVRDRPETKLRDLQEAFPDELQGRGMFDLLEDAREVWRRTGHARHFIQDAEAIHLADGGVIAVSSQWGSRNLPGFLQQAEELGFSIRADGFGGAVEA